MLCEKCGKRPANVFYTQIINGIRKDMHVCSECAKNEGYLKAGGLWDMDFGGFFSPDIPIRSTRSNAVCPVCGMGVNDFISGGKFGCEECYNVFSELVEGTLKNVHGSSTHTGKLPGREGASLIKKRELNRLKRELQEAVLSEQYEKAVGLRDKIRELEGQV